MFNAFFKQFFQNFNMDNKVQTSASHQFHQFQAK